AAVAEVLEQLPEFPQVVPQLRGRHGGVLPALPGVALAGDVGGRPEAVLADLPQDLLLPGVVEELHGGRVLLLLQPRHAVVRAPVGLLLGLAAELDPDGARYVGRPWQPGALH